MSADVALGPGEEFDVIRALLAEWGPRARGIGDDAATLALPRGEQLVVSVDSAVEGRHFRREWLSPREIGYRSVTAALSDLAAMAARPVGVLLALIVPDDWRPDLRDLAAGVGEAVDAAQTCIVGGNLSAGNELSITTTVLGTAYAPVSRAGARVGDGIYVTGRLGAAGSTLRRLLAGTSPDDAHRARFARPAARIAEARWLAARGATAMIDISDGLAADLRHLAWASGRVLAIDAAGIPRALGVSLDDAVVSGEEYELVVTLPAGADVSGFDERFGIPLTRIGIVEAGEPAVRSSDARVAPVAGYDHFSR